jgi:deoxyribodipyrimidine photo-lyase
MTNRTPLALPPLVPTRDAAHRRIVAIRPAEYARSRNHLDGAVTGLSPYLTHGIVSLAEVLRGAAARHPMKIGDKFVFELGWRAYFHHVWAHRGDAIFTSLHEGPLPDAAYRSELPADLREGRTGIPVIDQAVHTLYASGTLHNHARMWLASYAIHVRKTHWRVAADWLYGHLLDGDLASNHLSWQWVAGTGSQKPYLFNAENVARHAPRDWHSPGSVIDAGYDALEALARDPAPVDPPEAERSGVIEPALSALPTADALCKAPAAADVRGREVWLVHPWSLGELPDDLPPQTVALGLWVADFHRARPWNARRWDFVATRMAALTPLRWHGDAATIGRALAGAKRVRSIADPHLEPWLSAWADCRPPAALFPDVQPCCDSFSQWWGRSTAGLASVSTLLAHADRADEESRN